jgi:DNA-binding transcriptional ArsR family regulator
MVYNISMDVFYALADPRRRMIIDMIASNGQMSAGEICKGFKITAQAVSQHLRILRESGLLSMRKNAQQHIYQINSASVSELETWAHETTRLWNDRFDALDNVLESEKKLNAKKARKWQTKSRGN